MGYTPHVLVVGGGVTGTAVARDLSMRGLDVTLAERDALAAAASTRMHGLLHSGARYAVDDPESARECIAENRVLRDIAGHCIRDTGGLFVDHPDDPDGYFAAKREACRDCEIPVEELSGDEARAIEPALSGDVRRALRVPDGALDPCRLVAATATDARRRGAEILTHTRLANLVCDDRGVDKAVLVPDGMDGTSAMPDVDYVVNAAGPWAGEVAGLAGLDVPMAPSKGALAVVDFGGETVVNRCRPREEGDILVPHGDRSVLGATDVPVDDPDDFEREQRELDELVAELAPVVPAVAEAEVESSFWGVRPLFGPGDGAADEGATTRGFRILDHEDRDGLWGISTVLGGKFTTHRLMGRAVGDHVCEKFGIDRESETATTPLPAGESVASFDTDPPLAEWCQ